VVLILVMVVVIVVLMVILSICASRSVAAVVAALVLPLLRVDRPRPLQSGSRFLPPSDTILSILSRWCCSFRRVLSGGDMRSWSFLQFRKASNSDMTVGDTDTRFSAVAGLRERSCYLPLLLPLLAY